MEGGQTNCLFAYLGLVGKKGTNIYMYVYIHREREREGLGLLGHVWYILHR